jgi:hypothetical protein
LLTVAEKAGFKTIGLEAMPGKTALDVTVLHQKGKALEMAVHALESAILRRSPGYSEKTFQITGNKIISVGGVHHEIDTWVNVDLGGYGATFIFECKNRTAKATKNDIVVFAEKIKAAQAQTGFFIARSFTRDAKAQASIEPRIQLLCVHELPMDEVPVSIRCFHGIFEDPQSREIVCRIVHGFERGTLTPVDVSTVAFTIDGERLDLGKYIYEWSNEEVSKTKNRFRSESVAEGVYPLTFEAARFFSDRDVIVNHKRVAQMMLSGRLHLHVVRGSILSRFEVATRGRIIQCLVELPNGVSVVMHQQTVFPK